MSTPVATVNVGDSVQLVLAGQPTRPALVARVFGNRLDLVALLDVPGHDPLPITLLRIPQLSDQVPGVQLGWIPPPVAGDPAPAPGEPMLTPIASV